MTVKQLIKKLSTLNPKDKIIVVTSDGKVWIGTKDAAIEIKFN